MRKGNAGHEEFAVGIEFHVAGRRACFDVVTCDGGGRGAVTEQPQQQHYIVVILVVGMKQAGEGGFSSGGHRSRK